MFFFKSRTKGAKDKHPRKHKATIRWSDGSTTETHAHKENGKWLVGGDHPKATLEMGGQIYIHSDGKIHRLKGNRLIFQDNEEIEKAHKDKIKGGLADKKKPGDFDRGQLKAGIKVEMEHTDDKEIAREIAMDHLSEDPDYYKKLKTIEKAKPLPVGSVRRRKAGQFIKDRPGHWKMLKEIVHAQHTKDDVHPNHHAAKMMQRASFQLVRYIKNHDRPMDQRVWSKWLDDNYADRFERGFPKWKRRVMQAVQRYTREMYAAQLNEQVGGGSEALDKVQAWRTKLEAEAAGLKSDVERDAWVAKQFHAAKKPIAHLLYSSRAIIGYGVPLKSVSGGFKDLCKAIIEKAYDHGPSGFDSEMLERFTKAFDTFFKKVGDRKPASYRGLKDALAMVDQKMFWKKNPRWFVYCCTRQAMKNEGVVDMASVTSYMQNAMRKHKNPPRPDYDDPDGSLRRWVELGLTRPKDAIKRIKQTGLTSAESFHKEYKKLKRLKKSFIFKGAMRKLAPKPNKEISEKHAEHAHEWVQNQYHHYKNELPRMEGANRKRMIHKLASKTKTRINKETGEREYHIHRVMSEDEYHAHRKGEGQKLTSFTPEKDVANRFAAHYANARHKVASDVRGRIAHVKAWVPESHLHSEPRRAQVGKTTDTNNRSFNSEHEILVHGFKPTKDNHTVKFLRNSKEVNDHFATKRPKKVK